MKKPERNDILLMAGIIAFALILLLLLYVFHDKGAYACVYVDGVLKGEYPLYEDREVTVTGYEGGTNILIIKDNAAYMKEASCPDKLCVHQGKANTDGQSIVCLPNRVVIQIKGRGGDGYDAVTR